MVLYCVPIFCHLKFTCPFGVHCCAWPLVDLWPNLCCSQFCWFFCYLHDDYNPTVFCPSWQKWPFITKNLQSKMFCYTCWWLWKQKPLSINMINNLLSETRFDIIEVDFWCKGHSQCWSYDLVGEGSWCDLWPGHDLVTLLSWQHVVPMFQIPDGFPVPPSQYFFHNTWTWRSVKQCFVLFGE